MQETLFIDSAWGKLKKKTHNVNRTVKNLELIHKTVRDNKNMSGKI